MPAIDNLMKRLGFVKLRDFGLVLTPEGRILSIRPAVLDDGLGGRIVGWKDDDLAAMELDRWAGHAPKQPAPKPAVAGSVAARPVPTAPVMKAPVVVVPPIPAAAPIAIIPERAQPVATPLMGPAIVAAEPVVEEDDWEWTIAIVRARAAAEEVEEAVVAARPSSRRLRAETVPPPVVAAPAPKFVDVKAIPIAAAPAPTAPMRVVPSEPPRTVIPVPRLPQIDNLRASYVAPVVRSMPTPLPPAQPRRFAKGTGPHLPSMRSEDTMPGIAVGEDTTPNAPSLAVARRV